MVDLDAIQHVAHILAYYAVFHSPMAPAEFLARFNAKVDTIYDLNESTPNSWFAVIVEIWGTELDDPQKVARFIEELNGLKSD